MVVNRWDSLQAVLCAFMGAGPYMRRQFTLQYPVSSDSQSAGLWLCDPLEDGTACTPEPEPPR